MRVTATPMFPLGTVLLPGTAIPLHVFEPRYVTMVRDLLESDDNLPHFGVVMIERGFEVGGGDIRASVGTLAAVTGIQATPQGGYALLAAGVDRFRVTRWLPDDPYPLADTEPWPDESSLPSGAPHVLGHLVARAAQLTELATELGEEMAPALTREDLSDDPWLALYQLAGSVPIGPADRFKILASATFERRVDAVAAALDDALAVLEFRRS
jgi:Lon protease-like protein